MAKGQWRTANGQSSGTHVSAANIASVSWADHLTFGEGDGRLATPDALARRLARWRDELDASAIHWRMLRRRIPGRFYAARGHRHPTLARTRDVTWDDVEIVPRLAHDAGLQAHLYVSLFDEGWPLAPARVRAVSYHNAMHGQHVAWQSDFSRAHPEYAVVDRNGAERQWGVLSLAYPEVRAHFRDRFVTLLAGTTFDGLFVCLRSQSKPPAFADQFGFNEPVRQAYQARYGRDILTEDFAVPAWRDLLGEYLTRFVCELRDVLRPLGTALTVGAARGDVVGPPLGNWALEWRRWIADDLVDALVIDQNSSRCPSMWHELWPMHRGYGYVRNYLNGLALPPLVEHLTREYAPVFSRAGLSTGAANDFSRAESRSRAGTADLEDAARARLFVARQWHERSPEAERELLANPAVSGVVFSSFRFDNPAAVARNDWRA